MSTPDPRDITERLTEEADNERETETFTASDGQLAIRIRPRPTALLREAASTIAHLRGERRSVAEAISRADRAEARVTELERQLASISDAEEAAMRIMAERDALRKERDEAIAHLRNVLADDVEGDAERARAFLEALLSPSASKEPTPRGSSHTYATDTNTPLPGEYGTKEPTCERCGGSGRWLGDRTTYTGDGAETYTCARCGGSGRASAPPITREDVDDLNASIAEGFGGRASASEGPK